MKWLGVVFIGLWITVGSANGQFFADPNRVHDPSIIKSGNLFYLFCTGRGIVIKTSPDLLHWKSAGTVFQTAPVWTREYSARPNDLWAPDISFVNGEYRIYYAASSFGTTHSAIGLVTNKTLDSTSPDCRWVDRGEVIATPLKNNWNALDPCAFLDDQQKDWLVTGSCWTGIKMLPLDVGSGLLAKADEAPLAIASRPRGLLLEEGYIRKHGDFYYLWMSFDHCCRGVNSDYKIVVSRSKQVTGPYVDRANVPTLEGGGTVVLASKGDVNGPGSCAIIENHQQEFLVHHFYDGTARGQAHMQVRPLSWDTEGWPIAGSPITTPQ